MTDKQPHVIDPCSEADLKAFVQDVLAGRVYTQFQMNAPDDIGLVFMPVMFGAFEGWTREELEGIGCIYARMEWAMGRSINGQPCFDRMMTMNKADWIRAREAIKKAHAFQESLVA